VVTNRKIYKYLFVLKNMAFQYESTSVEHMRAQLIRLPSVNQLPSSHYDVTRAEFRVGDGALTQKGSARDRIPAVEVAELTLKKNGSAYSGYKSITKAPTRKLVAYVGGFNSGKDVLVIGGDVERNGNLGLPAKLSLQDLVGYRIVEQIPHR
jgi:hypothetical protein